jgi:hypothetical protein
MSPIPGIVASQISGHLTSPTSYESISTQTVSSAVSSISFLSIPSTYKHLQIRAIARCSVNSGRLRFQFNGDTGTNYSDTYIYADGGSASGSSGANISRLSGAFSDATANIFGANIIDILDYTNANKFKATRTLSGIDYNGAGGEFIFWSGSWRSTATISSILMYFDSGNITQYSSFALYGIRG